MFKHRVLITEEQIHQRVQELADALNKEYKGQILDVICVLKGSFIFVSELIRKLEVPVRVHFLQVSSYGTGTQSSGTVSIHFSTTFNPENKDVLLVEDILDTGITLDYLLRQLKDKTPRSLKLCVLLYKPERRKLDITPDYVGFQIPDEFVIGFGLDYQELGRNMNYIAVLDPSEYKK
jgi:hypoxanthine phosphoribosyltransferase